MQFDIWRFFEKSVEKIYVSLQFDKNNGYFKRRPIHIYENISLGSPWNRNVSDKSHILYIQYVFPDNRAVYEIMWKNMVPPERQEVTILLDAEKIRFACRISKARIHTHSHTLTLTHKLTITHSPSHSHSRSPNTHAHTHTHTLTHTLNM
jgi:hypothetical protein